MIVSYQAYEGCRYAELMGKLNASLAFPYFSNLIDLFLCEFRHRIFFSFCASTFLGHIRKIVLLCSEKKMIRIDAWRIVAFVAYIQSIWNWSKCFFIGPSVCPLIVVNSNIAISSLSMRNDYPTTILCYCITNRFFYSWHVAPPCSASLNVERKPGQGTRPFSRRLSSFDMIAYNTKD
jgi:hypothetical protein